MFLPLDKNKFFRFTESTQTRPLVSVHRFFLIFFFNNWDCIIDQKRLSDEFEKESDVLTVNTNQGWGWGAG